MSSGNLDFEQFRTFLEKACGILLGSNKQYLVSSRLNKLMEQQGIKTLGELVQKMQAQPRGGLREQVVDAMTTNETLWFRDTYPFEVMKNRVLPELIKANPSQRLRIWSAGCSTGEEPYSIAMTAVETFNSFNVPVSIVASDLDTNVLATAAKAVYAHDRVDKISPERLSRFFVKGTGAQSGTFSIKPELRRLVTFQRLNLLEPNWAIRGPIDALFCRNVMIYFDKSTQYKILKRFAPLMSENGLLFAGHSESFLHAADIFRSQGKTVYQLTPGARVNG